jgi:regulator of sigma E protease
MNVLIAFLILYGVFLANGTSTLTDRVGTVDAGRPAAGVLRPGDRVLAVDGHRGDLTSLSERIASHRCAGRPVNGCRATTPARITVERDGVRHTYLIYPRYDAARKRTRVGFAFHISHRDAGPIRAAGVSVTRMWDISKGTVSAVGRVFDPQKRKEISGVVGSYEVTRQSFGFDTTQALIVLAIISLSLAIVNLFPFLPLDGGHIFWALAEKVRGRPIPVSVMERAGALGFVLVIFLFAIGLTNDIDRLRGTGFGVR